MKNRTMVKQALSVIKKTHSVIPLNTIDIDDSLIHPYYYEGRFRGALIEITFTMSHIVEPGLNHKPSVDIFSTNIVKLRMLDDPLSITDAISFPRPLDPYNDIFENSDEEDNNTRKKRCSSTLN
jgi:hypothetical protein